MRARATSRRSGSKSEGWLLEQGTARGERRAVERVAPPAHLDEERVEPRARGLVDHPINGLRRNQCGADHPHAAQLGPGRWSAIRRGLGIRCGPGRERGKSDEEGEEKAPEGAPDHASW